MILASRKRHTSASAPGGYIPGTRSRVTVEVPLSGWKPPGYKFCGSAGNQAVLATTWLGELLYVQKTGEPLIASDLEFRGSLFRLI